MFGIRRRGGRASRFTIWKVAILLLAAGIWLAGVMIENTQVTAAAIIVLGIGLVLVIAERREEASNGAPEEVDSGIGRGGEEEDLYS